MSNRTTAAEFELRVTEVEQLCLDGYSRAQIVIACKKWDVADRTITKYISKAMEKITDITKANADETKSVILSNLWDLARNSKTDPKERHKLLMSIAKISGFDKLSLHVNIDEHRVLKNLSSDDLHAIVNSEVSDE